MLPKMSPKMRGFPVNFTTILNMTDMLLPFHLPIGTIGMIMKQNTKKYSY